MPVVDRVDVIFLPDGSGDPEEEDDSNVFDRSYPFPHYFSSPNELNP